MIENQIKTIVLLGFLTGLLIGLGGLIGGYNGLFFGLVFALVVNFGSYWFSDKIVLAIYRAKEAQKAKYKKLYGVVEEVAKLAGIPTPKIYIIPSNQSNAFATGRNKDNAVVAFTDGILRLLSEEELKGVTAHEISHIKNKDILVSAIAATIAGIISYIAMIARWGAIFGGFGGRNERNHNLLELLILSIIAPLIALVIRLAISRSREYLADESGAAILRNSSGLAGALEKLESSAKHSSMNFGNESTSHLFIVNPFTLKGAVALFRTHPETKDRVNRLKSMKFY